MNMNTSLGEDKDAVIKEWNRIQRKDLGWGDNGYREWSDPECVEESSDYEQLWKSGNEDWHENGRASTIVDSEGVTCMIFD